MNNIIIHPEYSNLKTKLEDLKTILTEKIAEKDDLIFHESKDIEAIYILKIGYLEFKIFEIKLNIQKIRREIALIQKQINLQENVDLDFIKNQIEIEFEKYILELEEKVAKVNIATKRAEGKRLSKEESIELKKIYKELILKLHPDLNENITKNKEDLLFKVMDAYESADLEKLRVLKVLAIDISNDIDDEDSENILDELKKNIDLLEIRLNLIDKEIEEVKKSYPYNKKALIENDKKLEENKKFLENELSNYLEILNDYKIKLDNLLKTF
jgi:hypothetical protein